MLHGQRQQVDVGQVLVAENTAVVDEAVIQQLQVVRPEFVIGSGRPCVQQCNSLAKRPEMLIALLRADPQKTVLGKWTGCPAKRGIRQEPRLRHGVMQVLTIGLRQEDANVED